MQAVADWMLAVAAVLVIAWIAREVRRDERVREATADDEVWHAGADMLRRARERLQHRKP